MYRREINILSRIVHLVGFICKIVQGCTVNKSIIFEHKAVCTVQIKL